ncbi:MAG TPA: hypothetical protein VF894_05640 [Anaeromyxobacter sp.]
MKLRLPSARALLWAGSPLALATVALPLAAGLLAGSRGLGMTAAELASVPPVRAYALALAAALAVAAVRGALERRTGRCALALGGLAILGFGAVRVLGAFTGFVDLGEGEPPGRWTQVAGGPLASHPPTVEVRSVPPSSLAPLQLTVDGSATQLLPGTDLVVDGARLRVVEVGIAPRTVFVNEAGTTLDEVLVKLASSAPADTYLELPVLPHRFYLSRPRGAGPDAPGVELRTPDPLHLKVIRGKLTVLDRDVAKGESAKVDHITFKYLDGLPWARIELVREPGGALLYAGIALVLAGVALELYARRGVEPRTRSALS